MRIVLAALPSLAVQTDENLAGLHDAMRAAHDQAADLVVLPEAFGQGISALTDDPATDLAMGWEVDGPELALVRRWARDLHLDVLLPFFERCGHELHSSAVLVNESGGTSAHYRRVSQGWRDRSSASPVYVEGTEIPVFEWKGMRTTIALCGDLWDLPERWAEVGADLVLWPLWRDVSPEEWEGGEKQAYAEQSRRWPGTTLMVNGVGEDPAGDSANGGATVFSQGRILAEMPMAGPGTLTVDVGRDGSVHVIR